MDQSQQPQGQQTEPQLSKKQRRRLERMERKAEAARAQSTKKTGRRLLTWIIVLGVLGLIVWGVTKLAGDAPDNGVAAGSADPITASDWTKGNPAATVSLVEYSDLQCPACKSYYPFVKQLLEDYGDKVFFSYRHFPLRTIHKNAAIAAQAAEAAGLQGKFWEFHDILFEKQTEWSALISTQKKFEEYATTLGLDIEKFKTDLTSDTVKAKVEANEESGKRANVQGTPSFYINGKFVSTPPRSVEEFKTLIDSATVATTATTTNAITP